MLGPVPRETVYSAIDTERTYQEEGRGNAKRHEAKAMTVGEFILCMERYVAKARDEWTNAGGVEPALHSIRKATALGVHCMELHGAPPREGLEGVRYGKAADVTQEDVDRAFQEKVDDRVHDALKGQGNGAKGDSDPDKSAD